MGAGGRLQAIRIGRACLMPTTEWSTGSARGSSFPPASGRRRICGMGFQPIEEGPILRRSAPYWRSNRRRIGQRFWTT